MKERVEIFELVVFLYCAGGFTCLWNTAVSAWAVTWGTGDRLVALDIQLKDTTQWSKGSGFILYLGKQRWDGDLNKTNPTPYKNNNKKPHKQIKNQQK